MKLVTVSQMREIEKQADAGGVSYAEMMENAGRELAEIVQVSALEYDWNEVVGLVGSGNNGGDTLVALAHLAEAGWQARAYIVKREKKDKLTARLLKAGGEVTYMENDKKFSKLTALLESANILLDGLLGTGTKLPLKEDIAGVLEYCQSVIGLLMHPPFIIAVDCPSGVDCDTGAVADECLPADLTVTMAAVKQGLLKLPAFEYIGELETVDIGLPDDLSAFHDLPTEAADEDLVAGLMPERELDSHKGTFGTALIAAGSLNYTGAAFLAGSAAYRSGAGLVTLAVPEPLHAALAGHLPEATWVLLPHESGFISENAAATLLNYVHRASAFLLGPGLGFNISTRKFVEEVISQIKIPAVVDADGLRHIEQIPDWHKKFRKTAVLTPHVGEMAVLTGLSKEEIQSNRHEVACKYAKQWGHVVVLKGAFTVIASPDGRMTVIPVATPALARAGTGDVLAGLIVGLSAQGLDPYDAAVAGAYIHAHAGLRAAEYLDTPASVMAGDVLEAIADIISELE
jgi:NAD(P)H-hydrate epimerase